MSPSLPPHFPSVLADQFIACGKSRDVAHELASQIWLAVLDNLEENQHTFLFLKCLALEGDVSSHTASICVYMCVCVCVCVCACTCTGGNKKLHIEEISTDLFTVANLHLYFITSVFSVCH